MITRCGRLVYSFMGYRHRSQRLRSAARLFVHQRLNAASATVAAEVAGEIRTAVETPSAAPTPALLELATTDEFRFVGVVEFLVHFAIVVPCEGAAAYVAFEGAEVEVCADVVS